MPSNLLMVSLVIALLATTTTARPLTSPLAVGDSATYSYTIVSTVGKTVVNTMDNEQTVAVDAVYLSQGVVEYTETISEFNNTVLTTPIVGSNTTAIFDPYDNLTYFGQPSIGWYPFTYTDLETGSTNVKVNVTVDDVPGAAGNITESSLIPVNASVFDTRGLINIDFNFSGVINNTVESTAKFDLQFNSTTGWLQTGVITAVAYGEQKVFTYQLLSYQEYVPSPNYALYSFIAAVVAIGGYVGYRVASRKRGRQKTTAKMREKLSRRA